MLYKIFASYIKKNKKHEQYWHFYVRRFEGNFHNNRNNTIPIHKGLSKKLIINREIHTLDEKAQHLQSLFPIVQTYLVDGVFKHLSIHCKLLLDLRWPGLNNTVMSQNKVNQTLVFIYQGHEPWPRHGRAWVKLNNICPHPLKTYFRWISFHHSNVMNNVLRTDMAEWSQSRTHNTK